jgi:flagellar hook-associated protein 3 FlgL
MRITTTAFFDNGSSRLSELQTNLDRLSQQISSGRKLLTPSQDPAATVQALELSQAVSVNTQYETNRQTVRSTLGTMDSTLSGMLDTLASMQEQAVSAGNGTFSATELTAIAQSLDQHQSQLMPVMGQGIMYFLVKIQIKFHFKKEQMVWCTVEVLLNNFCR